MLDWEVYKRVLPSVGPIVFRNVFLLVNGVIGVVVVLLFIFGNPQAGLFLGIVFVLNTVIAIAQDIHARVLLEKLQMLTALKITRINSDKTETLVLAEEIAKGDMIKLKLGDQTPCEGVLVSADNLEISEALVTGESDSIPKKEGDKIIAGAVITSGNAVMRAEGLFRESRLSKIAGDAEKYATNPSSIQRATNIVVTYAGYILIAVLLFVIIHGLLTGEPRLKIVNEAGALASTLVPQGLIVAITLLFAIGAASYSKRHVLFQEINATEKLGRIKNLCIDKTGTLTNNILLVEAMHILPGFSEEEAWALAYTCILGLKDSSQTIVAIKKFLEEKFPDVKNKKLDIAQSLTFSSWRRYGAVTVRKDNGIQSIFIGAPDLIIPRVSKAEEKKWLQDVTNESSHLGKRVLCAARGGSGELPKDLNRVDLSMIAVFVFDNTLRQGVETALKFFQDRGATIRVLSGDNADTVAAVAKSVKIEGADHIISGQEMSKWNDSDFASKAHEYSIFAQVLPEHKVKLIEVFKKDGFTAMVGDGVNDALAMKKSDLGIAMFDGAPVTRQLADVILMTNSFTDLPGAVELADHFIRSIEISSGIYINQSILGLFFFVFIAAFGYAYPLTPLNITFINYFTVGFSTILISYWALRPSGKILPKNERPFLQRVLPLIVVCGVIEALGAALVFMWSPAYLRTASSNTLVGLAFIIFGFLFLLFADKVYSGSITGKEKINIFLFAIFEIIMFFAILQIPFLVHFFNILEPYPAPIFFGKTLLIVLAAGLVQYLVVWKFFLRNKVS